MTNAQQAQKIAHNIASNKYNTLSHLYDHQIAMPCAAAAYCVAFDESLRLLNDSMYIETIETLVESYAHNEVLLVLGSL